MLTKVRSESSWSHLAMFYKIMEQIYPWNIFCYLQSCMSLWHALWKPEYFNQKKCPLLVYGTMNSDPAMEYVKSRNTTNGKGVLCGSAPMMTTSNNRGSVGGDVFWWEPRPSEVVTDGGPWWRRTRRRSPHFLSRCIATPSSCEIVAGRQGCEHRSWGFYGLMSVTRRKLVKIQHTKKAL